jgi:curved DNA-binding protein
MQYKDYYKILGVARDASADDIKRAYRKLARKYHPDVSKEADAEARFKEINEANEVLKDPQKRAEYDALGSGWHAGDEFRPPPGFGQRGTRRDYEFSPEEAARFSDFFSSIFGGGSEAFRAGFGDIGDDVTGRRGMDQNATIQITLEEAHHGATRQLRLEVPEIDAKGRIQSRARTLNVRIPVGVTAGRQIRLAGQGSPGPGGKNGDLYLEIEIAPHPIYRSEGKDLHMKLPISPWEAALGATVAVPTLDGSVNLKIPTGSQSGQRLRLKGRGLPGKPAGDIYVQLEIVNPPTNSDADRGAYRDLAARFEAFNPRAKLGAKS